MKEKEVISNYKKQKYVFYVEKEDGSYGTTEGGSYLIENLVDDFWHKKKHLEQTLRVKLLAGDISPIQYWMVLEELTPSELASRAGLSSSKVKKHLTASGFLKASVNELYGYSRAFNVPLPNLFQIVLSSQGSNIKYHFYNADENKAEKLTINQLTTDNPLLIITEAEELKNPE